MSQEERFGSRDRSYSVWHRRLSIGRYVGIDLALTLAMIDVDASLWVEYDDKTKDPIALIETALDIGQSHKVAKVTKNLARLCTLRPLPAYIVLYKLADTKNPADTDFCDIASFRMRRIWPEPETTWELLTPYQYAKRIAELRKWSSRRLDALLFPDTHNEVVA